MVNQVKAQPVLAGLIARWAVTWAASKGFELSLEQAMILFGTLEAVILPLVWKAVTPNVRVAKKVEEAVKRSTLPPGTIVGLVALALAGCGDPTAGALCRSRANMKWAVEAERLCPDTDKDSDADWDQCPHRPALLAGLGADLERCP